MNDEGKHKQLFFELLISFSSFIIHHSRCAPLTNGLTGKRAVGDKKVFSQREYKMSYKTIIYRILLTGIVFFALAVSLCHGTSVNVRVGIIDFDPLCRTKSPDKDGGLFLDILQYIAVKEGWNLEYVVGTLPECMERLENGEIHLMVAATYSKESELRFEFTRETVISTWAQVYALDPSKFQSLIDLKNCTIGLIRDESYNQGLREILKRFGIYPTFAEFNYS